MLRQIKLWAVVMACFSLLASKAVAGDLIVKVIATEEGKPISQDNEVFVDIHLSPDGGIGSDPRKYLYVSPNDRGVSVARFGRVPEGKFYGHVIVIHDGGGCSNISRYDVEVPQEGVVEEVIKVDLRDCW